MRKKIVVGVLVLSQIVWLTACSRNKTLDQINDLPKQSMLSKQQVMDYYAQETSKENQLSKKSTRAEVELREVTNTEVIDKLKEKVKEAEKEQQNNSGYTIDKTIHENIKAQIDGMTLSNSEVEKIEKAMGYYYVTVKYNTGVNTEKAELRSIANYLGINGIIIRDIDNNEVVDNEYKGIIDKKIKEGEFKRNKDTKSEEEEDVNDNSTGLNEDYCSGTLKLKYDINEIDREIGNSMEQVAFMPSIDMIAEVAEEEGDLSGYGLYINGSYGMRKYGYDSSKYKGEMRITYVFKQSLEDSNNISYEFCYINDYNSGVTLSEDKADEVITDEEGNSKTEAYKGIVLSEFIKKELDKIVERGDRVINNCTISGLVGSEIYEDAGLGIKYGLYSANTNIVYLATNVDKVLARDVNNGIYLVKASRLIEEIVNWNGTTARYRDTYYMVIRQDGTEFRINDELWVSRETEEIPEVDDGTASERRLVALNLAGNISEENKTQISESLNRLYTASTLRKLNNSVDADGNEVPGMYDCFTDEREILSSERLEYLNSQIRSRLLKLGVETGATYTGNVITWIGGNDNQAEVIAEELIEYEGTDKGLYLQNYYLLENINGIWEIVDINNVEEREVSGEELAGLKN